MYRLRSVSFPPKAAISPPRHSPTPPLIFAGCFSPSSLDRPVSPNGDTAGVALVDFLGEADPDTPAAEARVVLAPVVKNLKPRDQRIVYLRFFEQKSQQEIADEIGVTQMQVSRLLARILRDLYRDLTTTGEAPAAPRTAGAQAS